MTMLRMDAEDNDAPELVITLTSRRVDFSPKWYAGACAVFWRAFRRRYGRSVEFCGFIEWTTGTSSTSGGHRRLHSHWLVKLRGVELDELSEVEAWVSSEWAKLTGAWVVEVARLKSAGGVVGYLALHHEKWQQRPPEGWTGRRLRPSKGYFSEPGAHRRARARLWLAERHQGGEDEYGVERVLPVDGGRIVWGRTQTMVEITASTAELVDEPGRFDTLPAARELDARLRDPAAPINWESVDAWEHDASTWVAWYRRERARAAHRRALARSRL